MNTKPLPLAVNNLIQVLPIANLPKKVRITQDDFTQRFEEKTGMHSAWRFLVKTGAVADV